MSDLDGGKRDPCLESREKVMAMRTSNLPPRTAMRAARRIPTSVIPNVTSFTVPEFLAPALLRPVPCPTPATRRRPLHTNVYTERERERRRARKAELKALDERLRISPDYSPKNAEDWMMILETNLLPSHLLSDGRRNDHPATAQQLARFLDKSSDHDALAYICLEKGRWDIMLWIVHRLVEDGPQITGPPTKQQLGTDVTWPEADSLRTLTDTAIVAQRVSPAKKPECSLADLTAPPPSLEHQQVLFKRAVGQVWRTLGLVILRMSGEADAAASPALSHALEVIAYLHHAGIIPPSVYSPQAAQHHYALQQPPTLHMLSSQILTALSDATWRAHEAAAQVPAEKRNAQFFMGRMIPGSQFQFQVAGVAPELWLELVLWTCLHGGWISDGTAILERMHSQPPERAWNVLSWKQLMESNNEEEIPPSWSFFGRRKQTESRANARLQTQRTISSEVVTAFVDGLVNDMYVGVGTRGTYPERVLDQIKILKQLLDRNNHSLGSTTWDSVMVRLLESGGIVPENRPELLLNITTLAAGFGTEVASINASSQASPNSTEPPYFYEPTTTTVSLLHRTMWSSIENGDLVGAMTALNALQQHTDDNKQRSLQQFFEKLKSKKPYRDEPFTDRVHSIDFPAFEPQLPVHLLAKLLDLATDANAFYLGRWLLKKEELDGPLITREMYRHPTMAAAIIRFGTLAGESDLVMQVVKDTGFYNAEQQNHRLPDKLLTTLMASQVHLHRWQAVKSMQHHVLSHPGYRPKSSLLATFATELLRDAGPFSEATSKGKNATFEAFRDLVLDWEHIILSPRLRNDFYAILAILSTISPECKVLAADFTQNIGIEKIQLERLATSDFHQILSGTLDGYGSAAGRALIQYFCADPGSSPHRSPGGVSRLKFEARERKADDLEKAPPHIELAQPSGAKLILGGRVHANRQTIWAVLRKTQEEVSRASAEGKQLALDESQRVVLRATLEWAVGMLYRLGLEVEDVVRDLGDLSNIAEFSLDDAVEARERKWRLKISPL